MAVAVAVAETRDKTQTDGWMGVAEWVWAFAIWKGTERLPKRLLC